MLGIPAGVKMHSAVFAVNPRSAGELVASLAQDGVRSLRRAEVMDVDEALLRAGSVSARLHGFLNVPDARRHLQNAKARSLGSETVAQEEIAHHLVDNVLGEGVWLIGPGTTTGAVLALLGLEKTLLGVDVVRAGNCVIADADEPALLDAAGGARCRHRRDSGRRAGIHLRPRQPAAVRRSARRRSTRSGSSSSPPRRRSDASVEPRSASTPAIPISTHRLAGYTRVTVGYNRELVYPVA